jgi:hypothetical protein
MGTRGRQAKQTPVVVVEQISAEEKKRESPAQVEQTEEEGVLKEFAVLVGLLDNKQLKMLARLDRIEQGLAGPLPSLAVASGYSRPTPPKPNPPPSLIDFPPHFIEFEL